MDPYDSWIACLRTFPEGRIWLNNFEFDKKCKNLTPQIIAFFVDAFQNINFEIRNDDDAEELMRRVKEAFDKILETYPQTFDLKGTRYPAQPESYCRAMILGSFVNNNFDYTSLGLRLDENLDDEVWSQLDDLDSSAFYYGSLRTGRKFFWCARTQQFNDLHRTYGLTDRMATEIRNQFGLCGIGEGERLLQILIPPERVDGKIVRAPTVLDAGVDNFVFVPSNDNAGCGWTLNLKTCQKGVEEVVIEELPFSQDYTVIKLGSMISPDPPLDLSLLEIQSEERLNNI
ncbi:MAG TPA: hypothetical protein VF721_01325 [Pyrinomonadaceae bacterium]|jgi:hypothetical protein